jgi:hypothetical protein
MLLTMSGAVAAVLASRPPSANSIAAQMTPQPLPSPNAPANENVPAGLDGANIPVRGAGRPIPPATWMEIKSDAQKLYQMAASFATQVDNTNLTSTFPLSLLKDAHNIEKMAKHIRDRMKS